MKAAWSNKMDQVQDLIKQGKDVNLADIVSVVILIEI
jgi:hypothetical protein